MYNSINSTCFFSVVNKNGVEQAPMNTSVECYYMVHDENGNHLPTLVIPLPYFSRMKKSLDTPQLYFFDGKNAYVPVLGLEHLHKMFVDGIVSPNPSITISYDLLNIEHYDVFNDYKKQIWDVITCDTYFTQQEDFTLTPIFSDRNGETLVYKDDGMFILTDKKEIELATGIVATIGTGLASDGTSIVKLLLKLPNTPIKSILINADKFESRDFISYLNRMGVVVFDDKHLINVLKKQLSSLKRHPLLPEFQIHQINQLGWCQAPDGTSAFNVGTSVISANNNYELCSAEDIAPIMYQSGTLNEWKDNVFKFAFETENPTSLGLLCVGLAPLLFTFFSEIQPVMLVLLGKSGVGKTLLQQLICTLFSNGSQNPSKGVPPFLLQFNATSAGLEAYSCRLNGLPMCIEELGLYNLDELGKLVYNNGAGMGKILAKADSGLKDRKSRRTMLIASSEKSARDALVQSSDFREGQTNRLFEISFNESIFPKRESSWGKQLQANCGLYFGTPALTVIEYIINNQYDESAFRKLYTKAEERIVNNFPEVTKLASGATRVLDILLLSEVVGKIAIEAKVFPVKSAHIEAAIDHLVKSALDDYNTVYRKLARYIEDCISRNKVGNATLRVDSNKAIFKLAHQMPHDDHQFMDGIAFVAHDFDMFFGDVTSLAMRQELREKGVLRVTGNRLDSHHSKAKIKCYAIKFDETNENIVKLAEMLNYTNTPPKNLKDLFIDE